MTLGFLSYIGVWGLIAQVFLVLSVLVLVRGQKRWSRPRAFLYALGLALLTNYVSDLNLEHWFVRLRIDDSETVKSVLAERQAEEEGEEKQEGLAASLTYTEEDETDLVVGGIDGVRDETNALKAVAVGTNTLAGGTNTAAVPAGPAWRLGGVKVRGGGAATNQPGVSTNAPTAEEQALEQKTEMLARSSESQTIYMKVDKLNIVKQIHRVSRMLYALLLYVVVLAIVWDYSTTFNDVASERLPLPLSSPWIDNVSPKTRLLVITPDMAERWRPEPLLARAIRKGEKVIYFGQNPIWQGRAAVPRIPTRGWHRWRVRLPVPGPKRLDAADVRELTLSFLGVRIPLTELKRWRIRILRHVDVWLPLPAMQFWQVPIIRYGEPGLPKGSEFVFDAAWFGRYLPLVTGQSPCLAMLADFMDILHERRGSGACSGRTLVIAWDRDEALPESVLARLAVLAEDVNLSIFVWTRQGRTGG